MAGAGEEGAQTGGGRGGSAEAETHGAALWQRLIDGHPRGTRRIWRTQKWLQL